MEKIAGLLVLVGLWMLVARQGEASPVHLNLNERKLFVPTAEDYGQPRTYIVHMDQSLTHDTLEIALSSYSQLLQNVKQDSTLDSNGESATIPLHVYSSACHGFSAHLTSQEAEALRQVDGVLGVFPDSKVSLHTTRTPEFLGLNTLRGLWPDGHFGDDVIIGMIDTGVWPERESFSDVGLGPIPARWKGTCVSGQDFDASHCNKKLIGARYYFAGYEKQFFPLNFSAPGLFKSPRDDAGHGTHTASTAAGAMVRNANLYGSASGTARGMAPKARIAVYKVCWTNGDCAVSDILAAIDQAVADGVDIISLSLGDPIVPYTQDNLAIGAFGAMKKGIFVSCSAGNEGPEPETVKNIAPWVMTVAASTLDRAFPANVKLGDGQIIHGESLTQRNTGGAAEHPTQLISGADAALSNVTEAALCFPDSLNPALVKGKIVVCQRGINPRVEKGAVVLAAGGAGMILFNTAEQGESIAADPHLLPTTHVGAKAGATLLAYMKGTRNPVGKFQFLGTKLGVKPAPAVTGFSSRGPNLLTPEVLKPDITGPGLNVLAAWSETSPTGLDFDTRTVDFNIISGTSMSCPHISGLAALLKVAHPKWSPAAIKSAMMTTATRIDNTGGNITDDSTLAEATPFAYGAGHVRPERALDPGLVYDLCPQDYVNFLCASHISAQDIKVFIAHGETVSCPRKPVRLEDMNYPSFSAVFKQPPSHSHISMKMKRTVTNVGHAKATYSAHIMAPPGIKITVHPKKLRFCSKNQKKKFTLKVKTVNTPDPSLVNTTVTEFAYLVWSDGVHAVQSPIAITVQK